MFSALFFTLSLLSAAVIAGPTRYSSTPYAGALRERQASPDYGNGSSNALMVDLGYAIYQGIANATTNLNVFKGIRYAAPPTGTNRWQAAQTPAVDRGASIIANQFGPSCPQSPLSRGSSPSSMLDNSQNSEDCLFLNVYAPSNATEPLPVLVWIHGGGYGQGNGRQDLSQIINTNNNGFIGVAIQYRLGAFGFLSGPDVALHGLSNAGIHDQLFALQWVQSYISLFGGDPRRVTISGESAGAGSVMLLDLAYNGQLGTSLFEQSIVASPYLPMQQDATSYVPTQAYYAFATAAGCPPTAPYGAVGVNPIFTCLQSQSSGRLINASAMISAAGFYGTWAFLPVTDGTFITSLPSRQLLARELNGLNILSGNNANEGAPFTPQTITNETALITWLQGTFPMFDDNDIAKVLLYYPSANNTSPNDPLFATTGNSGPTAVTQSDVAVGQQQRANNIYAETTFVCPSYWLAEAYSNYRSPFTSTLPAGKAYKYQFSVVPALHGNDVSGYFGRLGTSPFSTSFSTAFQQIWGNFIISGNPSISEQVAVGTSTNSSMPIPGPIGSANPATNWPEFSISTPYQIDLNQTGGQLTTTPELQGTVNVTTQTGVGAVNDFRLVNAYTWEGGRGQRCDFWRSLGGIVPE